MKILAILLIVIGTLGLIYGGFTYTKDRKKADLGPVEIHVEEKDHVRISPLAGGIVLAGGVALLALSSRRRGAAI